MAPTPQNPESWHIPHRPREICQDVCTPLPTPARYFCDTWHLWGSVMCMHCRISLFPSVSLHCIGRMSVCGLCVCARACVDLAFLDITGISKRMAKLCPPA